MLDEILSLASLLTSLTSWYGLATELGQAKTNLSGVYSIRTGTAYSSLLHSGSPMVTRHIGLFCYELKLPCQLHQHRTCSASLTVWILKVPGVCIYHITHNRPHHFASATNASVDWIVWWRKEPLNIVVVRSVLTRRKAASRCKGDRQRRKAPIHHLKGRPWER